MTYNDKVVRQFTVATVLWGIVGMFLALLELVRHHGFRAEQTELGGEITQTRNEIKVHRDDEMTIP